ncbi:hypothetical protein [Novosphingopyxis sp.]|uniref:hypothetical protein n=1 Tax=Novosphingopyxis sp. TaxID=2709690 RepID=UPI003B595F05
MFSRNLGDEALSADCAECCALHASYVEGCHTLEEVEIAPAADSRIREVRDWVTTSRRSWLAAVRRTVRKPAHTSGGLMAKAPVVKGMLLEICADNEEAVSVTIAFLDDLERLFSQRV